LKPIKFDTLQARRLRSKTPALGISYIILCVNDCFWEA